MLEKEKLNWSVEKQDLAHCLKEKQKKLAVLDGDVVSTKAKLRSMQKENDDLTDKLSVCLEELKYVHYSYCVTLYVFCLL